MSYPKSIPREINSKYSSIAQSFVEACKAYPEFPAFSNMGKTITYAEILELSKNMAAFFKKEGLKKGDRVAIQLPNLLQFPICLFGALRAGLVVVNVNPLYTARELKHQLNDAQVSYVVILENFASELEKVIKDVSSLKKVIITEIGDMLGFPKSIIVNKLVKLKKMVPNHNIEGISFVEALKIGSKNSFKDEYTTGYDLAFLQYTGGTTGVSKGVMLTNKNMVSNMDQVALWMQPILDDKKEIVITALPLYHIFALTVNLLSFIKVGALNVLITNPRDIKGFVKTLKQTKFTIMTGVNTLFRKLLSEPGFMDIDWPSTKLAVAGGMALNRSVFEEWKEKTGSTIIEGYGLTEASPVVTCNPVDGTDKIGTIGLPLPSTKVKLLHEEGAKGSDPGELCVKGPQVMRGYWKRPEATQKVLDSKGWLKTGDIATIDKNGFVKIVDRKKDMVLVSGFNVYPNEVEDILCSHPEVLEACVIGKKDKKSGEMVKAFLVVKNTDFPKEEIINFCKAHLVGYKVPKEIEYKDELPKTNVGKILRRAMRDN